jgi:apolipoprotein N-acyltransferase
MTDGIDDAALARRIAPPAAVRLDLSDLRLQLALACASGLLLAHAYSLEPIWWTAWLGPAPVLAAAMAAGPARRFLLGLITGLLAGTTAFSYHALVSDSTWLALLILVLRAIGWAAMVGLTVRAWQRWPWAGAVFVLPAAAAALETTVASVSPHSSAGSLAYSQMDALPVIQVASIGGAPAIVFLVLSGGSLLGLLLFASVSGRIARVAAPAAAVVLLAGASLGFGAWRLAADGDPAGPTVALVTADSFRTPPSSWSAFWSIHGPALNQAARPGTSVVLPEAAVRLSEREADAASRALADFARARKAMLVIGMIVDSAGKTTNRALVTGPDGARRWYLKQHLVPGFESRISAGSDILTLDAPVFATGIAICKDMHFPDLGRAYGRAGVRLMLVPAYDFDIDGRMSARITALRGVEGGYAVARAARHGMRSISDRYGRMLLEQPSESRATSVAARVPVPHAAGATMHTRGGWMFGWLCVAAIAGIVLRLARASRPLAPGRRSQRR